MRNIKKILFISLSNIGDAVLTTPCLSVLRKKFPDASIDIVASPKSSVVFTALDLSGRIWIYNKRAPLLEKMKWIYAMIRIRYDLVIDLRHTMIPLMIFPRYRSAMFRRIETHMHAVEKHLAVLENLGLKEPVCFMAPMSDAKNEERVLEQFGISFQKPYIVLGPGAASPLKRWGADKFLDLAQQLSQQEACQIVIVGDKKDLQEVGSVFEDSPFINLLGKTDWQELSAVLRHAKLFITNDSGPMHLAVSLGTRTVAIFGPTDPDMYGPYGKEHKVVRLDLDCIACMKPECPLQTHACLKNLGVRALHLTFSK